MRLSDLQKHILKQCFLAGGRLRRKKMEDFYGARKKAPSPGRRVKIVTQSLERLIDRGVLKGFGVRTAEKWFIKEIKLTPAGRRLALKTLGEQQSLPIKFLIH